MSAKADNRTSKALHFQCRVLTQEVYCVSSRTASSGITREGGLMTISIAVSPPFFVQPGTVHEICVRWVTYPN